MSLQTLARLTVVSPADREEVSELTLSAKLPASLSNRTHGGHYLTNYGH